MKFRKKPVIISAMQWDGSLESIDKINSRFGDDVEYHVDDDEIHVYCHTLEGQLGVSKNDWIIKGIKGEVYPCKPDIFDATYVPAGD